ncbi:MAG TPA: sigma-70 family RNA polymerase sigma factor [Gemmataceae bacterium]|jgi:RNA polymerase sigma-70 factor (ECF subfamily)
MYDNEELARLLNEARKGNKRALGHMLMQLRPWIRRQAEGLLGQRLRARMDGSDIVQDVHVRAFEHFGQFQGDSLARLNVWVEEILRNVITDCRRRHGAGKRDAGREQGDGDQLSHMQGHGTTPSQGAMRIENQARLFEALQRLPEKYRRVLQLRFYDGLPFEEVAQKIGVTVGNARVLAVRAIEKLKNEIGAEHEI